MSHPTKPKPISIWAFVLKFVLVFGGLELLFFLVVMDTAAFQFYLEAYAALSAFVLELLGGEVTATGAMLSSKSGNIEVRRGCDAFQPIALYWATVSALPSPWLRKGIGILIGTLFLLLANLGRIIVLFWLSYAAPDWFETAHFDLFPLAFIILTLLMWTLWARWAMRRP